MAVTEKYKVKFLALKRSETYVITVTSIFFYNGRIFLVPYEMSRHTWQDHSCVPTTSPLLFIFEADSLNTGRACHASGAKERLIKYSGMTQSTPIIHDRLMKARE